MHADIRNTYRSSLEKPQKTIQFQKGRTSGKTILKWNSWRLQRW